MERQKSGCSQIKVGALFVKGPHNSKDLNAGRRRSAGVSSSWGSKILFMYGKEFFFLSVRGKEFFYMMMTTLLYGRGKRRFAAQLQHFPKLKSGGSGLFSDIEANALFVKCQLKFM